MLLGNSTSPASKPAVRPKADAKLPRREIFHKRFFHKFSRIIQRVIGGNFALSTGSDQGAARGRKVHPAATARAYLS